MKNLLDETKRALDVSGKKPKDVKWIGSKDGKLAISWRKFAEIADFGYDNSYGSQLIASDLVVVGDNWWLERGEYDGSEWWEYHTPPTLSDKPKSFTKVTNSRGWSQLENIN